MICAIPLVVTGLLYLGGVISQFIRNYSQWRKAGGVPGMGTSPKIPSLDFPSAFWSCFTDFYGLAGLFFCVLIMAVFLFGVMHLGAKDGGVRDKERNLTFSQKGTYGTAALMNEREAKKILHLEKDAAGTSETILGKLGNKLVCFPADSFLNRNIAVCGPPGSRKTRSFTRNMMFQCIRRGESLIVTDPKGEIYSDYREYLVKSGYEVRVFNANQPECSDAWDLVGEVQGEELSAQIISNVLIRGTGGKSANPFWDGGEQNLLKALLLLVDTFPEKSMEKVYEFIAGSTGSEVMSAVASLQRDHPARIPFGIFMAQDDVTRGKIVNGLGTRLQIFQNRAVCEMTSHPEINLSLPGVKKCAYFCISSDQHSAFDFLSSLFITFSFIRLVELADKQPDKRLPVPVHILGEEAPNTCCLEGLGRRLSVVRSRGISMSVVFQSIPQMQNRFPDNEWLEIISDCDTQLFLACSDPITADYISKRSGMASVAVNSQSKQLNSWRVSDYTPQYRETNSVGKRPVLNPDEAVRMAQDEALVILRGQNILKVKKFDYTEHPDSQYLTPYNATDHVPAWRLKPQQSNRSEYKPANHKGKPETKPDQKIGAVKAAPQNKNDKPVTLHWEETII